MRAQEGVLIRGGMGEGGEGGGVKGTGSRCTGHHGMMRAHGGVHARGVQGGEEGRGCAISAPGRAGQEEAGGGACAGGGVGDVPPLHRPWGESGGGHAMGQHLWAMPQASTYRMAGG